MNKEGLRVHPQKFSKKLDCKCCNQRYSGALFVFFFFLFRSNSVFSGAVLIYAKDINVFEKVGDRAKRGLQRKGGPGVLPWK